MAGLNHLKAFAPLLFDPPALSCPLYRAHSFLRFRLIPLPLIYPRVRSCSVFLSSRLPYCSSFFRASAALPFLDLARGSRGSPRSSPRLTRDTSKPRFSFAGENRVTTEQRSYGLRADGSNGYL